MKPGRLLWVVATLAWTLTPALDVEAQTRATELLDPWGFSLEEAPDGRFELPSEVIDPFTDMPLVVHSRAPFSEVLDPWAAPTEPGLSLSAPAPGRAPQPMP